MSPIPEPISQLAAQAASQTASKSVASFSELVTLKIFGGALARARAQSDIEYNKEMARWEQLEKPLWLQAEALKMERQYTNQGNVLLKASSMVTNENKMSSDNDVFWGLLEHAKEISSEEVQDIIAKIIAGEYNKPGTYSMSTLQILKSLGKKELEDFEKFGSLLVGGNQFQKTFFDHGEPQSSVRKSQGFNYSVFIELQNLGLIQPNDVSFRASLKKDSNLRVDYFNENLFFKIKTDQEGYSLPSVYLLSQAGQEIMTHLNPVPCPEFLEWLKQSFNKSVFESAE